MGDAATSFGLQIRAWRQVRGLSQFELASQAGFSARHVSFIETGRARPSREPVLALGEVLDLSFRERNRLLEAAGFAHVFGETPLSADEMSHVLSMFQFILDRHLPYAAIAMDRHWNCVPSNRAASQFFPMLISPALGTPPQQHPPLHLPPGRLAPLDRELAGGGAASFEPRRVSLGLNGRPG